MRAAPSIGTVRESLDNAVVEPVMGLFKTELHRNAAALAGIGDHWRGLDEIGGVLSARVCSGTMST